MAKTTTTEREFDERGRLVREVVTVVEDGGQGTLQPWERGDPIEPFGGGFHPTSFPMVTS